MTGRVSVHLDLPICLFCSLAIILGTVGGWGCWSKRARMQALSWKLARCWLCKLFTFWPALLPTHPPSICHPGTDTESVPLQTICATSFSLPWSIYQALRVEKRRQESWIRHFVSRSSVRMSFSSASPRRLFCSVYLVNLAWFTLPHPQKSQHCLRLRCTHHLGFWWHRVARGRKGTTAVNWWARDTRNVGHHRHRSGQLEQDKKENQKGT